MTVPLKQFCVGIDVSKLTFEACACEEGALPASLYSLPTVVFKSTKEGAAAFARWVASLGGECHGIVAESTGIYSQDLAARVAAADKSLPAVAIVNPAMVKGAARALGLRDKSDAVDARVIAAFGAWQRPVPAPPRSPAHQELRAAVDLREALLERRLALENRIEATRDHASLVVLRKLLAAEQRQIEKLDKAVAKAIAKDEQLCADAKLIGTIPGVGPVNVAVILAHFGDLRTWKRGQVVASAGLYPKQFESGTSVRGKPRLAKGGGSPLRKKLYMAAIHLLSKDYGFNATALRLVEAGRPKMVALCAAMRKILLLARALVISGKKFANPYPAPNQRRKAPPETAAAAAPA